MRNAPLGLELASVLSSRDGSLEAAWLLRNGVWIADLRLLARTAQWSGLPPASIEPPVTAPLILALCARLGDLAATPTLPPGLAAFHPRLSRLAETLTSTGRATTSMSAE